MASVPNGSFQLRNLKQQTSANLERETSEQVDSREEQDRAELRRLGKNPVLKRSYNFLSITGFTCTVLVTWEAALRLAGF